MKVAREKASKVKLSTVEKELVKKMGQRWLRMSTDDILSENAVLFRLAVAIVGMKSRVSNR